MCTDSSEITCPENTWPTSNILTVVREERLANILLPTEFEQQLTVWNTTQQDHPQNAPIRKLLVLQASATANAVVLAIAGQLFNYRELNWSTCTPLVRGTICRL